MSNEIEGSGLARAGRLETEKISGDAQAIIDIARQAAIPDEISEGVHAFTVPAGGTIRVVDTEEYQDAPRRKAGTVKTATVEAFTDYVKNHDAGEATTVWVHPTLGKIVAVLDDHSDGQPAWGGHRAQLEVRGHGADGGRPARVPRLRLRRGRRVTVATAQDTTPRGGRAFHHQELGRSGCFTCGWFGVPIFIDGVRSDDCPVCDTAGDWEEDERLRELPQEPSNVIDLFNSPLFGHRPSQDPRQRAPKVGRNEPCPCGSGKKSKRCCAA